MILFGRDRRLSGGREQSLGPAGPELRSYVVLPSRTVTDQIYTGNAQVDGMNHRGWILGHFMSSGDARHSKDVEIRWAVHQPGEQREQWVEDEQRSTAIILIKGRFKVELPGQSVILSEPGDYVVFHGISHSWKAETHCIVLGIRWPSIPGYQTTANRHN